MPSANMRSAAGRRSAGVARPDFKELRARRICRAGGRCIPAYCDYSTNPNINVNHWNMNSYSDVENILSPPSSPWTQSTLAPQLPLNFGPESGGTPIAGSLCDTMFNLASDTGFTKTIIFETDGAENDSQYLPTNGVSCAGSRPRQDSRPQTTASRTGVLRCRACPAVVRNPLLGNA